MATNVPEYRQDHLLRLPAVIAATGIAKSTLYLWIQRGEFPTPVQLGARSVAWRASDVAKWIESRPTAAFCIETTG